MANQVKETNMVITFLIQKAVKAGDAVSIAEIRGKRPLRNS